MLAGYGLGENRDQKVAKALTKFKSSMTDDGISGFLEALNVNGIEISMNHNLTEIEPELVAFIKFGDDEDQKSSVIYIDKDIDDYDLFFYIAHEVGHHMMHYVSGREIPQFRSREKNYDNRFKLLPRDEQEADVFAYNLLMPEDTVRSVCDTLNKVHEGDREKILAELADYFFTGRDFVVKRLDYLKISIPA